MKKLLLSGVAFTALAIAPALAADLPRKAPVYVPPPPPFSWTGFYVGATVGVIGQDVQGTDLGHLPDPDGIGLLLSSGDTYSSSSIGVIGGGNIGYNWQFANNWVIGLEADISGTSLKRDNAFDCSPCDIISTKLDALGTVRARFGYAFDRALLYVTGGWAYGHVKDLAQFNCFDCNISQLTASSDQWRSGWTVGGGLEYAVTHNWTVKAEALYVDLGTTDTADPLSGCRFGFKHHYAIGRLGFNYKF